MANKLPDLGEDPKVILSKEKAFVYDEKEEKWVPCRAFIFHADVGKNTDMATRMVAISYHEKKSLMKDLWASALETYQKVDVEVFLDTLKRATKGSGNSAAYKPMSAVIAIMTVLESMALGAYELANHLKAKKDKSIDDAIDSFYGGGTFNGPSGNC